MHKNIYKYRIFIQPIESYNVIIYCLLFLDNQTNFTNAQKIQYKSKQHAMLCPSKPSQQTVRNAHFGEGESESEITNFFPRPP